MFTYAGLVIIVPIFVFAIANYEATPAGGVSTVADVIAYQKKAEETLAQIYRSCDHARVEERERFRLLRSGSLQEQMSAQDLGLETTTATSVFVLATRLPFYFASRWRRKSERGPVNRAPPSTSETLDGGFKVLDSTKVRRTCIRLRSHATIWRGDPFDEALTSYHDARP